MIPEFACQDSLFLILIHSFAQNSKPLVFIGKRLFQFFCDRSNVGITHSLLICEDCFFHLFLRHDLFDSGKQLFRRTLPRFCQ